MDDFIGTFSNDGGLEIDQLWDATALSSNFLSIQPSWTGSQLGSNQGIDLPSASWDFLDVGSPQPQPQPQPHDLYEIKRSLQIDGPERPPPEGLPDESFQQLDNQHSPSIDTMMQESEASRISRASTHPRLQRDLHKDTIRRLYEDNKLKDIVEYMKTNHGFSAT